MRSYLGLIPQYEKVHRKNNRISVLCITLSVCLVMAIFSMADMAMRSQKNYFIKTNGEYHAALHDVEADTVFCWTRFGIWRLRRRSLRPSALSRNDPVHDPPERRDTCQIHDHIGHCHRITDLE